MITFVSVSASLDVSYLVEHFQEGAINRPTSVVKVAGGKALNAARASLTLGAQSRALVILGGRTGESVLELLSAAGLPNTIVTSQSETRSCISIASEHRAGLTEVYERAKAIEPDTADRFLELLGTDDGDWVALAGSVPEGLEPAALARVLGERRRAGAKIAVDTHGEALKVMVEQASPDLVKVNRAEAVELLGTELPTGVLAEHISRQTGGIAVVTDSVHGSAASAQGVAFIIEPDRERGRYPVGSGDAFFGGLLAALDRGDKVGEALQLGAASATANALVPGAGTFTAESALAVLKRTVVQ